MKRIIALLLTAIMIITVVGVNAEVNNAGNVPSEEDELISNMISGEIANDITGEEISDNSSTEKSQKTNNMNGGTESDASEGDPFSVGLETGLEAELEIESGQIDDQLTQENNDLRYSEESQSYEDTEEESEEDTEAELTRAQIEQIALRNIWATFGVDETTDPEEALRLLLAVDGEYMQMLSEDSILQGMMRSGDFDISFSFVYDDVYHEKILLSDEQMDLRVGVTNNTNLDEGINVYFAIYSEIGRLVSIEYYTYTSYANSFETFQTQLDIPVNGISAGYAKVFVWKAKTAAPISDAIILSYENSDHYGDYFSEAFVLDDIVEATGWIDFSGDEDYLLYMPTDYDNITIDVVGDVSVELYDASETIVSPDGDVYQLSNGQTYYIKIYNDINSEIEYSIKISEGVIDPEEPEPEYEPDDHPNTAEEAIPVYLDLNSINRFDGVVDYREDRDWFNIVSASAERYSLLMSAPSENVLIAIYDSNLNLLSTDRNYIINLSASEDFYIEVTYDEIARFKKSAYSIQIGKVTQNSGDIIGIDVKSGKTYNVSLNVKDSADIGAKVFTVYYDANLLQLITAAGQASALQTAPGKIPGSDVTIISHSNGELVVEVNRPSANLFSGMATILRFEGIADGIAEIEIE